MTTTAFGSKLRQEREKKNISLRELAKKIGVSGALLVVRSQSKHRYRGTFTRSGGRIKAITTHRG